MFNQIFTCLSFEQCNEKHFLLLYEDIFYSPNKLKFLQKTKKLLEIKKYNRGKTNIIMFGFAMQCLLRYNITRGFFFILLIIRKVNQAIHKK